MKKIFRKNQIIITTLAVMIAVAGYLNYSGTMLGTDETLTQTKSEEEKDKEVVNTEVIDQELTDGDISDISEEDIFTDTEDSNGEVQADASKDANVENKQVQADSSKVTEEGDGNVPGEAVLTSNPVTSVSFIAEAKMTREQVRSKNKEILLEVVNNTNVTDEQKQAAIDGMLKITDNSEREMASEVLLEAKGFTDAVVTITDQSADVVINMEEVTDAKRAQIEDIMKRKTGVSAENIVITPIQSQE